MLTNLLAGGFFLGFLALGLLVVVSRRGDRADSRSQRFVSVFILYTIAISLTAVLSRRDLWPFSTWTLMVGTAPLEIGENPPGDFIVVLDSQGREFEVDYRAWEPFTVEELYAWLPSFANLPRASKDRVAAGLLARVNVARERVLAGKHPGYFDRWLGPLTAPHHFLHPAIWTRPDTVSQEPFVGCRFYREYWNLLERGRDSTRVRRVLLYEYRALR